MKKILTLLLAILALGPVLAPASLLTISSGILDVPGNTDTITSYSLKRGEIQAGVGFGVLRLWDTLTVDIALMGTQKATYLGTNLSVPLKKMQTSILTLLWPELARLEAGVDLGWQYSISTNDDGNTQLQWGGLNYGLSLLLRY